MTWPKKTKKKFESHKTLTIFKQFMNSQSKNEKNSIWFEISTRMWKSIQSS